MLPAPYAMLLPEVAQIMRNPGRPILSRLGDPNPTLPTVHYCGLCSTPIPTQYSHCGPCQRAIDEHSTQMPGLVVPLTYAGATPQSRRDVYGYKAAPPNTWAVRRLSILMYFFTELHRGCIRRHTGQPITSVVTVPSGRNRVPHPLDAFLRGFPDELKKSSAKFVGEPRNGRAKGISPADFDFEGRTDGEHVLIVEDSWVSGANALSLALRARQQGAAEVSVLTLARFIDPTFDATATWMATAAAAEPFDPLFCPVTWGACPPEPHSN